MANPIRIRGINLPINLPPLNVPSLLSQYGLRPDKKLGQNFLIDAAALARIVEIAEVGSSDIVLEIGPGLGSLTRYLAVTARQVLAVELDRKLIPVLKDNLLDYPNVILIQGDILNLRPDQVISQVDLTTEAGEQPGYLVVANIPYYITSALLRHLLEAQLKPTRFVLTVQREVAERICARPGELSLLALSVQVYGQPQIKAHIPAGSFYPAPQVDSAVVRVDLFEKPVIPQEWLDDFFRLAKAGYSQKRKTLRNSLAGGMAMPSQQVSALLTGVDIDPQRRAETLSIPEWKNLTENYRRQVKNS